MTECGENIRSGGMLYVPQIAVQYIYLDFDGESTSYNGEIFTLENVEVQNSALTAERISGIVAGAMITRSVRWAREICST